MSSSDADAIAAWNNISAGINRYFSIFIFLFGVVGNVLNTLVLSDRSLRTNPCSLLFLISSIASLIAILAGLTTRMLSGWTLDLTNTIDWLCKSRAFVLFLSRNIASWLILLAVIDRWLLSSLDVQRRRLSNVKNAYRGIVLTVILSTLLYSPIVYCYQANLINTPLKCYGKTDICRLSNDLSYACLTIMIPIVLMFVFGVMTIFNIRQIKSRVHALTITKSKPVGQSSVIHHQTQTTKGKLDHQLFLMLFMQIIFLSLFTLPQAIQKVYSTITADQNETPLQKAIDNFAFNFVLLLTYFANGMPFYIYTLSGGTIFRNAFKNLIQRIIRK